MPHEPAAVSHAARTVLVPPEADGQRLDNFLLGALALPRTRVYRLIRKGEVRVNKGRAKPMQRLSAGDQVRIPPLREEAAAATDAPPAAMLQRLERAVLLRRPGLIIIDKPAGWASQPGTGVRWSLVEAARALWGASWQPAHRLDRATSGCLAIVEGRPGMLAFQGTDWAKDYQALVHGEWPGGVCRWEDYLARESGGRVEVVEAEHPEAKFAAAEVRGRVLRPGLSLLQVRLETGRMHQIRVQAASRGFALLGDERYGDRLWDARQSPQKKPDLALHAVGLEGQWQGELLRARAPQPARWEEWIGPSSAEDECVLK